MTQPAPPYDLSGQRIVITGGSSGLGAACVHHFASLGATVFFCGLERRDGMAIADSTGSHFTEIDVRERRAVDDYIAGLARSGPLHVAINSAGISHKAALMADMDPHIVEDVMQVNVMGVWHAMSAEIRAMLPYGTGHVINIGSVLASKAAGWMAAYGTAKHAVIGMTRASAADYAKDGLRINAVSPGPIATPMYERAMEDIRAHPERFSGGLPPGGPSDPMDVAALIADLAYGEAMPLTGANLIFDPTQTAGAADQATQAPDQERSKGPSWVLDMPVDVSRP